MDGLIQTIPLLLIFGVFYVLVIRPQQQEQAAHDKLIAGLAKDDRVVTGAGLHGKVVGVSEATIQLEIARNTVVTLDKKSVVRKLGADDDAAGR